MNCLSNEKGRSLHPSALPMADGIDSGHNSSCTGRRKTQELSEREVCVRYC